MIDIAPKTARRGVGLGIAAGLAGGVTEVAWIFGVLSVLPGTPRGVAAGVAATIAPALENWSGAAALGLAVHMGLAIGLGVIVAVILRRAAPDLAGTLYEAAIVVSALAAVWAINFLVVLPLLNPDFVHIVPLSVSFISKILFGAAAAAVFWLSEHRRADTS